MSLAGAERARKQSQPRPHGKLQPKADALLAWYARHRRALPWRAGSGEAADPYRVWLSEIMLQQTTVKAVTPYYQDFLARWPAVEGLAAASLDDVLKAWAGLGYYARARNLHACAKTVVARHGGHFPSAEAELRALPGVGAYTAAAIAAIAFGRSTTPVDGNIERVIARLYAVEEELPKGKPIVRRLAEGLTPRRRAGDFAQALMDLGATICTPKSPACALCPWSTQCMARRRDDAEGFPRKTPKVIGRLRGGAAFWVMRSDGFALVRTRAPDGLLGGMTEVPTSTWVHDFDAGRALSEAPPLGADWRRLPGTVTHTFTHFPLQLIVFAAKVPVGTVAPQATRWVALPELTLEALPTLMREVVAHALQQ